VEKSRGVFPCNVFVVPPVCTFGDDIRAMERESDRLFTNGSGRSKTAQKAERNGNWPSTQAQSDEKEVLYCMFITLVKFRPCP
jgi:hypothetical protein